MRRARWIWIGLGLALLLALLAPLASPDPDGLERVAEDQGFADQARAAWYEVIPDYLFPGLGEAAGTVVAGIVGVLLLFGLTTWWGRALRRRGRS